MQNKKTGIIIVDYNNASDTINCVNSVLKYSEHDSIQIAIVDNGSSKENILLMEDYLRQLNVSVSFLNTKNNLSNDVSFISYIQTGKNLGYAKGNNVGLNIFAKVDEIEYILILNNDILLSEPLIESLKSVLDSNLTYGIVSPILYKTDGTFDYNCARKEPSFTHIIIEQSLILHKIAIFSKMLKERYIIRNQVPNQAQIEMEMPSGSCFLIRKDIFLSVNGFDANTFLYYEENILYRKLMKTKLKSVLLTTSSCIHLGASSTKKEKSLFVVKVSQFSLLYYLRNYRDNPKILILYLRGIFAIRNSYIFLKNKLTQ